MDEPESPLRRSISLSNLIRGFIALFAVLAIGAAFAAGHIGLGLAGGAFCVVAVALGYWAWRARRAE
jgi:hypothetical protein